jgi:hypothetical protein
MEVNKLRLSVTKTRRFCPSEAKAARFQASLSSPFGRGTMPAQPSNGFLNTQPGQIYIRDLGMRLLSNFHLDFFKEELGPG